MAIGSFKITENKNVFNKAVNRTLANHFADDEDLLFRARIMISTWILFALTFGLMAIIILFMPMDVSARVSGFILCTGLSVYLFFMMGRFRQTGAYVAYAYQSVAIAYFAIIVSILMSSGPVNAPSVGLFYLLPILATFFLGLKAGVFWMMMCIVAFGMIRFLPALGFEFFDLYDPRFDFETKIMSYLLALGGVVGMVITYEISNKKLRDTRDVEYERYQFLANHDELTKLANRDQFDDVLGLKIKAAEKSNKDELLAVLYFDLDGFKPINDNYGHSAGDAILREVANRMRSMLRTEDLVARQGGDEFLVLLHGLPKINSIKNIAEKLLRVIAEPIVYENMSLYVSASIGIAIYPQHSQNIEELKVLADKAMYEAKKKHNSWHIYGE